MSPTNASAHPAREHEQLAWQSGPGPTYLGATADEMLRNRYELMPQTLRYTLPRLLVEPTFRDLIAANKRNSLVLVIVFCLFVTVVAMILGLAALAYHLKVLAFAEECALAREHQPGVGAPRG